MYDGAIVASLGKAAAASLGWATTVLLETIVGSDGQQCYFSVTRGDGHSVTRNGGKLRSSDGAAAASLGQEAAASLG